MNIATGQLAGERVNVDKAIELGREAMEQFENRWPTGFDEKISKVVETQAEGKKHLKVGETKVFDTNLIYTRVIGLQESSRDIDINRLLAHELAPVPTSMFADTGDMKICKAKSDLKILLQSTVSVRQIDRHISCVILDGSAILYAVHWSANDTLKDYVNNFKSYLSKLLQKVDVYLVFDRYKPFSTNSVTRSGRTTQASRVHQLNLAMQLPPQNVVFTVTDNKRLLIKVICDELIQDEHFHQKHTKTHKLIVTGEDDIPSEVHKGIVVERADMITTHEEADNILVQQMVFATHKNQEGISVISDDTDVFVLLCYHYLVQKLNILVVMESPVKDRSAVDIRETVQRNRAIVSYLVGAHALSGCDTVGCYYGIGKGKAVKALWSGYDLPALGDTIAAMPVVVQESTTFIDACYGYPHCENMTTAQQKMWKSRVGKSSKSVPKLSSLPPTSESFMENVKRAHLRACIWK